MGNLNRNTRVTLGIGAVTAALLAVGAISLTVSASGLPGRWISSAQKQAALSHVATQQAQASNGQRNTNKQPGSVPTAPSSCPQSTIAPGVWTVAIGGEAFTEMYVQNTASAYHGSQLSLHYIIAGGALNANLRQGVIGVERIATDLCASNHAAHGANGLTYYDTPHQDGVVTLDTLRGDVIVFTTANGQTGSFNFLTGQYL